MSKVVNKKPLSPKTSDQSTIVSEVLSSYAPYSGISPLAFQLERFTEYLEQHKAQIASIMEAQRKVQEAYAVPLIELNNRLEGIGLFESETIKQTSLMTKVIANTFANSGLLEVLNSFKSIRFEAFAGLTIKSELLEAFETRNNDVVEVLSLTESSYLASGNLELEIEKSTTAEVSTQLIYTSIQTIRADVQALDENLNLRVFNLEKEVKAINRKNGRLLEILENNPFPYFKIKSIKFLNNSSQFIINGVIHIKVEAGTLQDYICQILFSGKKKLTEEWDSDEIIRELKALLNYSGEANDLTWKRVQDVIAKINLKISTKTTKDNLLYSPRSETLQLNPAYFD